MHDLAESAIYTTCCFLLTCARSRRAVLCCAVLSIFVAFADILSCLNLGNMYKKAC